MNILGLQIENIKRIKAIKIEPKGAMIKISGKNGQGKTSVMDSIAWALGGQKLIPTKPIRDGETTASITVELETLIIRRHWTSLDNNYLTVETKEGAQFKAPQRELDKLLGNLSFDPMEFISIEPKKRFEILRDLTGLDFTVQDRRISHAEEQRKNAKKDGETVAARLKGYGDIAALTKPADIEEIKKEKIKADEFNFDIKSSVVTIENKRRQLEANQKRVADFEAQQKRILDEISKIEQESLAIELEVKELKKKSEEPQIDTSVFEKAISDHHEYVANEKRLQEKDSLEKDLEVHRKNWKFLDDEIKSIQFEKTKAIEKADMPIKGLSFGEGEVLFNGIPFNQLSTSEQIKVSMAIAMKQNPKLKVIMIKNGSLLDDDAMLEVENIAAENGFQVWCERVSSKPEENSIHICEGERVE